MAEEKTFSAKQVATRIGTEAKILRKFFRDPNSGYKAVGQGGRYDFPEHDLTRIKQAFDAWNAGKTKRHRPTNAERELAKKAGLIPEQPKTEAADRPRRNQPPISPLDQDDLMTRCRQSIGERAAAHGLIVKQGRWVPKPMPTLKQLEEIPGLGDTVRKTIQEQKDFFDRALAEVLDEEPTEADLDLIEEDDQV